ncbi:MAG: Gfo/Idh/MocA family oxidoreductase [Candidatus Sumerlaeia bacterium]|nr:Gfo/Idh/MocA family oxidoreductase [Candidatus Sumerlaeia bacterium]
MNRRKFVRSTAAGAAGLLILRSSASVRGAPANEAVNIALVGCGGRGEWFVRIVPELRQNMVALCEVNSQRGAVGLKRFPDIPHFQDFRVMLDKMGNKIDAVIVAAPDHIHAPASIAAMKAGKAVYTEKPLTHNVRESRLMRETARQCKVATQMGNQGTASAAFRQSVTLIQKGVLGEVREVLVWNNGGGPGNRPLPKGEEPVPPYLNWDLWLGPAAFRPYNRQWMQWHGWREFGTGTLGNWACHTMNVAFKALKIDALWQEGAPKTPIRVQAEVSEIVRHAYPRMEIARYEVPARGNLPPVRLTWFCGGGQMFEDKGYRKEIEDKLGRKLDWSSDDGTPVWEDWAGILLIGSKGKLYANAHNTTLTLLPEKDFKDFQPPESDLPKTRGHEREWLDAIRGGPPAMSNFDYAGPLTEFALLTNVATQFEGPIEYVPAEMKITNNAEAHQALRREYRKGWEL